MLRTLYLFFLLLLTGQTLMASAANQMDATASRADAEWHSLNSDQTRSFSYQMWINKDQWRKIAGGDDAIHIEVCPGRYKADHCRVPDTRGINAVMGGTVTGEAYSLSEAIVRMKGNGAKVLSATMQRGGVLNIVYSIPTNLDRTIATNDFESIAVATPTKADDEAISFLQKLLMGGATAVVILFLWMAWLLRNEGAGSYESPPLYLATPPEAGRIISLSTPEPISVHELIPIPQHQDSGTGSGSVPSQDSPSGRRLYLD